MKSKQLLLVPISKFSLLKSQKLRHQQLKVKHQRLLQLMQLQKKIIKKPLNQYCQILKEGPIFGPFLIEV
jgi:hypothetical protein